MLPLHTHFIGIPVPESLCDIVKESREWMTYVYGCKSGYGTPPHITLVPPFALDKQNTQKDVELATSKALEKAIGLFPLEVNISGFGAFSERTVFAAVKDSPSWQKLHEIFISTFASDFAGQVKKSKRLFCPHLTIANRDIPSGTMDEILKHFATMQVQETFEARSVCIYVRTKSGSWTCGQEIGV